MNPLQSGDTVYVIQRNPHTQSVAHIQEAAIVENPNMLGELAMFFRDEYYPLSDDFAMYSSYKEAENEYTATFGFVTEDRNNDSFTEVEEAYEQ